MPPTEPDRSATKAMQEIFADTELWEAVRAVMVGVAQPLFLEAFMVGVALATEEEPPTTDVDLDQVLPTLGAAEKALPAPDPGRIDLAAENIIATYTDNWWAQFSRSTQNSMRRAIAAAAANGTGSRGAAAAIAPLFGKQRAGLIAVSEVTNLMGMGAHETYREAGYGHWEWRTSRDLLVDPICRKRDRKQFPMSVQFQRAHPGCRCWPVPAGKPVEAAGLLAG